MLTSKVLQKLSSLLLMVILLCGLSVQVQAASTKENVTLEGLKPELRNILPVLDQIHLKITGNREAIITDAVSSRPYDSLHPEGYAIDIRTRDLTDEEILNLYVEIVLAIGNCYDVLIEEDHMHIELDYRNNPHCDPHRIESCDTRE